MGCLGGLRGGRMFVRWEGVLGVVMDGIESMEDTSRGLAR